MIANTKSTRLQADVVAYVNHLSGLIWMIIFWSYSYVAYGHD
jgi:cob(I)alamin adenosyltransferase